MEHGGITDLVRIPCEVRDKWENRCTVDMLLLICACCNWQFAASRPSRTFPIHLARCGRRSTKTHIIPCRVVTVLSWCPLMSLGISCLEFGLQSPCWMMWSQLLQTELHAEACPKDESCYLNAGSFYTEQELQGWGNNTEYMNTF